MIVLKLLMYLAVLAGVLYLAYYTTRLIAGSAGQRGTSASMQVLEKVMLGKDSCLLIVRVGEKVLLLGVTPGGISKLEEIEDYQEQEGKAPEDFSKILAGQIKKGFGGIKDKGRGNRE